jgi:hypothetical protein
VLKSKSSKSLKLLVSLKLRLRSLGVNFGLLDLANFSQRWSSVDDLQEFFDVILRSLSFA